MRLKQEEFDKWIINFTKSQTFKQDMLRVFNELIAHISNLEPCEAVYPYQSEAHGEVRKFCISKRDYTHCDALK
jgi:hypothetical protein